MKIPNRVYDILKIVSSLIAPITIFVIAICLGYLSVAIIAGLDSCLGIYLYLSNLHYQTDMLEHADDPLDEGLG